MPAPNTEETIIGNDGEVVLHDVEELSVFHPDQLDQLADIQEELEKLEAIENVNIEDVGSMNMDDSIVDHEVTIVATQEEDQEEETILPEIQDDSNFLKEEVLALSNDSFPVDIENLENQEVVEQPCTETMVLTSDSIIVPSSMGSISQIINPSSLVYTIPTGTVKVKSTISAKKSMPVTQLKSIRPITTTKKLPATTLEPSKNVITKMFLSNNPQGQPIMLSGEGGQTIRIVGSPGVISSPTKSITLTQARQMGLLSPGKMHQIHPSTVQKSLVMNKNVIMNQNLKKTVTVVKTPTKILPLPATGQLQTIAPLPAISTGSSTMPQKIYIRQGSTLKAGTLTPAPGQVFRIPSNSSSEGQIHQIQIPGKQVQYVKLVNAIPASNTSSLKKQSTTCYTPNKQPVPVALATNLTTAAQLKVIPSQPPTSATRVIVNQAVSQLRQENSPATVQTPPLNNIVMVPAQYVQQITSTTTSTTSVSTTVAQPSSPALPTPIKPKDSWIDNAPAATKPKTLLLDQPNGIRPRKPCNCTKSQCLKLYCDCFANGEFCFQCNCNSCFNNLEHEEDRQRAIKSCLERNPNAFRPKIGKSYVGDERRHNKGCNCKRSGCLKNYCECYEAKIPCSNNCKCVGCRNVEEAKSLRELASVAEEKLLQQTSSKNPLATEVQDIAFRPHNSVTVQGPRQPFNQLLKQEIVEATCRCLLAINEKADSSEEAQCRILEEFGQCLVQIIKCAAAKQASSIPST